MKKSLPTLRVKRDQLAHHGESTLTLSGQRCAPFMSFGERGGGIVGNSGKLDGESVHSNLEVDEREQTQDKKTQEVLAFLIESGRAKSCEEAERHLESLNRIKEKLVIWARRSMTEKPMLLNPHHLPDVRFRGFMHEEEIAASELGEISPKNIDRTDPHIFSLTRVVDTAGPTYGRNSIFVGFASGMKKHGLEIGPIASGEHGYQIRELLTDEEAAFLSKEYKECQQELAADLKNLGEEISAGHDIGRLDKALFLGGKDEKY